MKLPPLIILCNGRQKRANKEESPKLNLKPLPNDLKYAYLEEDKYPVVISSKLSYQQETILWYALTTFIWRKMLSQFVNLKEKGIVLGHVISRKDIEVDKAKIELIVNRPPPTNVKEVRQFLGHCVPEEEQQGILMQCHAYACGGHFSTQKTALKVLRSGFYWPTVFKDAHEVCKFGVPKAIISDRGTHFCNKTFNNLLARYGVKHKVATPYHP
ncbi:hypothetical protein AAG906_011116 [Vitis piasezkii]